MPQLRIPGALNCLASKQFLNESAPLGWLVRVEPEAPEDSGWRLYSRADTPEYIEGDGNFAIVPYNDAGEIEPMILPVYFMPVGTELRLFYDEQNDRLRWFDENSNQDGKLDEVRFDDAFWAQFNQDYAAWVDRLQK